jgi:GR25 family glycosyltransferase involved in LPS biosynthesis
MGYQRRSAHVVDLPEELRSGKVREMYRGVFLNLERSVNRRESLVRHLEEIGASSRYERFEAVDGREVQDQYHTKLDAGNLGLWLTHEKLLHTIGASATAHLHIIEDDVVFSRSAGAAIEGALRFMDSQYPNWDLLFTDVFVQPGTHYFDIFRQQVEKFPQTKCYEIMDLSRIPFACTSSMIVRKSSVPKYANLILGKWTEGLAIDIYLLNMVKQHRINA